jgi:hypothetical protein
MLDIDETLCHSVEDIKDVNPALLDKLEHFTLLNGEYEVFKRPGLDAFLDDVHQHFNVSVWTAAGKDYAHDIIRYLFKDRRLHHVLTSDHCQLAKSIYGKKNFKDMRMLDNLYGGSRRGSVWLVDDHIDVAACQKDVVFPIRQFLVPAHGGLEILKDTELARIGVALHKQRLLSQREHNGAIMTPSVSAKVATPILKAPVAPLEMAPVAAATASCPFLSNARFQRAAPKTAAPKKAAAPKRAAPKKAAPKNATPSTSKLQTTRLARPPTPKSAFAKN